MNKIELDEDKISEIMDFCGRVISQKMKEQSESAKKSVEIYSEILDKVEHFGSITEGQLRVLMNGSKYFKKWNRELSDEVQSLLPEFEPPQSKSIEDIISDSEHQALSRTFNLDTSLTKQDVRDAVCEGMSDFFKRLGK